MECAGFDLTRAASLRSLIFCNSKRYENSSLLFIYSAARDSRTRSGAGGVGTGARADVPLRSGVLGVVRLHRLSLGRGRGTSDDSSIVVEAVAAPERGCKGGDEAGGDELKHLLQLRTLEDVVERVGHLGLDVLREEATELGGVGVRGRVVKAARDVTRSDAG